MTNYHKLFLDSTYRAPPFQPAKPFFTLFNASNYWLQAALVIAVFIILNMMPFMRQAAHLAGGTSCPSLFAMFKDAFVCKEKVHDICNQTPEGHNEPGGDDDKEEDNVEGRRYKRVREARTPACPEEVRQVDVKDCTRSCPKDFNKDTMPPAEYRCGSRPKASKSATRRSALKNSKSERRVVRRSASRSRQRTH